jgi:hypothetical protein
MKEFDMRGRFSGRLLPGSDPSGREVAPVTRMKARRCIPLRFGASLSEDLRSDRSAEHLHHAFLSYLAI